jgi:hypothetical protein
MSGLWDSARWLSHQSISVKVSDLRSCPPALNDANNWGLAPSSSWGTQSFIHALASHLHRVLELAANTKCQRRYSWLWSCNLAISAVYRERLSIMQRSGTCDQPHDGMIHAFFFGQPLVCSLGRGPWAHHIADPFHHTKTVSETPTGATGTVVLPISTAPSRALNIFRATRCGGVCRAGRRRGPRRTRSRGGFARRANG